MQKRKIDELISHFNRKVADMDIDMEHKMELLGMITAIGIACEKELSIEPERKTGEWIHNPDPMAGEGYWNCSECGLNVYTCTDYCPNCGARMER